MSAVHLRMEATRLAREAFAAGPGSAEMQQYQNAVAAAEIAERAEKHKRWGDANRPSEFCTGGNIGAKAKGGKPRQSTRSQDNVEYVASRIIASLREGRSASSVARSGHGAGSVNKAINLLKQRGTIHLKSGTWKLKEE